MSKLKTILFDLDGTLLPVNTDQFLRHYMRAIAAHASHLVDAQKLPDHIMTSTYAMIKNTDPAMTNAEVFARDFYPRVGRAEAELWPVIEAFYRESFPKLRHKFDSLPGAARQVVQTAVDQGYEIVLATNPLFPRIAIEERMRWIDVFDMPWRLVTTYEQMHACKPHPAYFQEILSIIGREPSECLMVGNDLDEDGVAAKVGMEVFFVTDYLDNGSGKELPPGRSGRLTQFAHWLQGR